MKKPWNEAEISQLKALYRDTRTADIAAVLERTERSVYMMAGILGLRKSAEYMSAERARHTELIQKAGVRSRFRPGQPSWNAGKKLPGHGAPHTQFKRGELPHTHRPVGSTRVEKCGILMVKVTDTRCPSSDWVAAHVKAWVDVHGPVPDGHIVVFKPGLKTQTLSEITADRVECITRGELMRRNSVHSRYPPEVARLQQLRGAITRQINKRQKEMTHE